MIHQYINIYIIDIFLIIDYSVCAMGRWACTKNICDSVCKSVGDHFTSFDGKHFDFNGKCNYILTKTEGMQDIAFEVKLLKSCT